MERALEILFTLKIFNCGYGQGFSVNEVIEIMQSFGKFLVHYEARRPGDLAEVIADSTKIQRVLGWMPTHQDLHHICESAFRWEQTLQKNLVQHKKVA